MSEHPQVSIVGTRVAAIDLSMAVEHVRRLAEEGGRGYIACGTVHSLMVARRDAEHRRALEKADLVTPDGMPLVWLSQWAGHPKAGRVYGPDLLIAILENSHLRHLRHYFLGGAPGVADQMVARLRKRFPDMQVVGTASPPFRALDDQETEALMRQINTARPDMLWVGLGAPKQEKWMAAHRDQLDVPVMVGIGAAFDFFAGNKKQAPKGMQRAGLEWLFRLSREPGRLWYRYLVLNPWFIALCLKDFAMKRLKRA